MAEIGIYPSQTSPHSDFGVTAGGGNFDTRTLRFTPRLSLYKLILPFHISSNIPIRYFKYNEWLDKVLEIGTWSTSTTVATVPFELQAVAISTYFT